MLRYCFAHLVSLAPLALAFISLAVVGENITYKMLLTHSPSDNFHFLSSDHCLRMVRKKAIYDLLDV